MKHRQTKQQKFNDLANAYHQIRKGEKVKRVGAKDGSIRTHPVVPVDPKKLEHEVLADCLSWLKKHHVMCNRHDAGTFQNKRGQWGCYGIINSGDIHGMLKNNWGKHFEIETKRGSGGTLSIGQQKRMKRVRDNGGLYFVCHGVEELEHFMGEWV
ncbi:hypothetical protein LCGC14_0661550 [marine sediment metagenome]|uniref:VRR-NUC domain-containing protein n=1 Tax=marine sediment metagenome TaxID=412755 RepID=A0A0F9RDJ6_9ZZZZ